MLLDRLSKLCEDRLCSCFTPAFSWPPWTRHCPLEPVQPFCTQSRLGWDSQKQLCHRAA